MSLWSADAALAPKQLAPPERVPGDLVAEHDAHDNECMYVETCVGLDRALFKQLSSYAPSAFVLRATELALNPDAEILWSPP